MALGKLFVFELYTVLKKVNAIIFRNLQFILHFHFIP